MIFTFEFNEREEKDLEILNCALGAMPLTELKMEKENGYLATGKRYNSEGEVAEVFYRYGIDTVTFSAEYEEDEEPVFYRVDTAAYEKGAMRGYMMFRDQWREENPDRTLRMLTQYGFEEADVFLVLSSVKASR